MPISSSALTLNEIRDSCFFNYELSPKDIKVCKVNRRTSYVATVAKSVTAECIAEDMSVIVTLYLLISFDSRLLAIRRHFIQQLIRDTSK
jgi:hypothetical protein